MLIIISEKKVSIIFEKYPDVLTVPQVCKLLGLGKNKVYRLLKNGEIRSVRIGKLYRIPKKCLEKYLNL